jgi:hypothetical protein
MGDRVLPYFATNPAASGVLVVAFSAFVFSEYRISRNRPTRGSRNRDTGSGRWVGIGLLASYIGGAVISLLVPHTVITKHGEGIFIGGLLIAAVGQGRALTPRVGHAQSRTEFGGSEMIQPNGKEKLLRRVQT